MAGIIKSSGLHSRVPEVPVGDRVVVGEPRSLYHLYSHVKSVFINSFWQGKLRCFNRDINKQIEIVYPRPTDLENYYHLKVMESDYRPLIEQSPLMNYLPEWKEGIQEVECSYADLNQKIQEIMRENPNARISFSMRFRVHGSSYSHVAPVIIDCRHQQIHYLDSLGYSIEESRRFQLSPAIENGPGTVGDVLGPLITGLPGFSVRSNFERIQSDGTYCTVYTADAQVRVGILGQDARSVISNPLTTQKAHYIYFSGRGPAENQPVHQQFVLQQSVERPNELVVATTPPQAQQPILPSQVIALDDEEFSALGK